MTSHNDVTFVNVGK